MQTLIRASTARSVPSLIASFGVSPGPLLRRAGFPADTCRWGTLAVTNAQMATLLDLAARMTGEPFFGALAGRGVLANNDPVMEALLGGPTLMASLTRAIMAGSAVHRGGRFRLSVRQDTAELHGVVEGGLPEVNHHLVEATFVMVLVAVRQGLGRDWSPLRVRLRPAGRRRGQLDEAVFAAPVVFDDSAVPAIVFDRADLSRAIAPRRGTVPPCTRGLGDWPDLDLEATVRTVIEGMIELQDLGMGSAARTLGCSPRSLQDHLARKGLSFSGLVSEARVRLAMRLLEGEQPSVTEIAGRLGYSDSANFTRAFRRWTGVSPSAFRQAYLEVQEPAVRKVSAC